MSGDPLMNEQRSESGARRGPHVPPDVSRPGPELAPLEPPVEPPAGAERAPARGFAAMDPETQRELAARGGREAHARGTAHEFRSDERAAAAGRKGGAAVVRLRGRDWLSEIGRRGAAKSAAARRARKKSAEGSP